MDREKPAMQYQHIIVDHPRPRVQRITLNRPEKRNALNNRLRAEVFDVLQSADRDPEISNSILRGAGSVLFRGLRPVVEQFGRSALPFGVGSGSMASPRRRRLVLDLGSCQAGDRAGARLLSCRRYRTRNRLRRGLRRRRCPDRVSAGAADEPARHAISSMACRHAPRHGIDADRGCDVRARGRRMGLCDALVSAR